VGIDGQLSLLELLKADPEVVAALTPQQLEDKFNLDYHFKASTRSSIACSAPNW
jgi:adenylosuccinate lyase